MLTLLRDLRRLRDDLDLARPRRTRSLAVRHVDAGSCNGCEHELTRIRTILLELERMWSHLNDIAAVCAGVGLAAGNNRFAAITERARRLNATLTGHRFLFGSIRIAGSALTIHRDDVRVARAAVAGLRRDADRGWRELLFNASFQDRLPDIGVVDAAAAERLGAVGPAARAAGLADDLRACSPRLAYEGSCR